jgi:hypothetical protein
MASVDNPRQPLINPSTSGGYSNIKYTESLPSTKITMTLNPVSYTEKKMSANKTERRQKINKRRSAVKDMFIVNMSRRLASRKELKQHM